jgi:hypothetical protein
MKAPILILSLFLFAGGLVGQTTRVDITEANRAREASMVVHRTIMQRIFGMNVSYSGMLVPRSKLRRLPFSSSENQSPKQPFENVSIHPITGRAEGVALFSINF